jgi:hypothetical protein
MIEGRMSAQDYEYDVFFSYKRHRLTIRWTREVQTRLQYFLSQEVGRETRLFVDEDCIDTGERWPEKLRESLRLSRCMICVWSPLYFQSDWCVSEWQSFRQRERQLNMGSHGLIAPVRFHDGDDFPQEARDVQSLDLRPFASTMAAFWASRRTVALEDRLKDLAVSVAKMVKCAPPFAPHWPVVEVKASEGGRIELAKL